ncbi:MAG: hypothetical protein NTZ90_15785 [Proteobacteria bacterium]|nr:hypothetical protein [Pseudomonadota bacterium]
MRSWNIVNIARVLTLPRFLPLVMVLGSMLACTTPNQVHELETKEFQAKGSASDGKIGINDKNQAVILDNSAAQDDLAVLELSNSHLRDEVERELTDLKACEDQLNDQRLGGSGRTIQVPDMEALRNDPEVKEDMGMDENGDLRVTREQSFEKRMKAEKKFSVTLKKMTKTAKSQLETCDRQLTLAREQHGLPGQRYKASGYFTSDGTWVETGHGEQNLGDAFEISAKAKEKAKAKGKGSDEGQ